MLVMMAVGAGLLGLVLYQTDLGVVWRELRHLGFWGLALILFLYWLCVLAQTASWLFTLRDARPGARWLYRLWKVFMVGGAFEMTTPLAGLGGEPVKALLLKRHYGVRYRNATASLVLARTTDLIGEIAFIAIGLALMFRSDALAPVYRLAAASGLAAISLGVGLFTLVQQRRALSRLRGWLERGWLARRTLSQRAVTALDSLHDIDERLASYYGSERRRLLASVVAAFGDWALGAVAVWVAAHLLGHPLSWDAAVVVESFLVLVRSALFFVPADIGTQEGALVLITGAVAGSPELGLALAAIRRARDLIWIAWGLAIGSLYSIAPSTLLHGGFDADVPDVEAAEPAARR